MQSKPIAFVAMPFKSELSWVYDIVIGPAMKEAGYDVVRADNRLDQQAIMKDVITGIVSATLVVVDLSESNPNVMYELGVAHALGIPTFLMTQTLPDAPFDLKAYRLNQYSNEPRSVAQIKAKLVTVGRERLKGAVRFSNPVADFVPRIMNILDANSNSPFGEFSSEEYFWETDQALRETYKESVVEVTAEQFMADFSAAVDRINAWSELGTVSNRNDGAQATAQINAYAATNQGEPYMRVQAERAAASALKEWADHQYEANLLLREGVVGLQNTADDLASSPVLPDRDGVSEWTNALGAARKGANDARNSAASVMEARNTLMASTNVVSYTMRKEIYRVSAAFEEAVGILSDLAAYCERLSSIIEERLDMGETSAK